jgi:hypothetical protein
MLPTNAGGHPKGMPKGQIKNIITHLKKELPLAYETLREAVAYPRNKKNLDNRYRKALKDFRHKGTHSFNTSEARAEVEGLRERNIIDEDEYDKRIAEESLIKTAYKWEKESITPDNDSVALAKWFVERTIDAYIKSNNEIKGKLSNKRMVAEINKELGITKNTGAEIVEEEEGDEEDKAPVFSLTMNK